MPRNPQFHDPADMPVATRAALCNGGTLNIYDGVQPATGATAVTGQNLLASLQLSDPAFTPPVAGTLATTTASANPVTPAVASRSGWAAWFRVEQADGTPVFDGSISSDGDLVLTPTTYIEAGVHVGVSLFTLTGNLALDVVGTGGVTFPPPAPPAPPAVPSGFTGTEPAFAGALQWCGYSWELEDWGTGSGQPKAAQVRVDASGYLHLACSVSAGVLNGAELDSVRGDLGIAGNASRWGYGTYQWVIGTDLASIDPALVLGLFTFWAYGSPTSAPPNLYGKGGPYGQKEIDVEVSNWEPEGDKTPGTFFQLGYYQDSDATVTSGIPATYGKQCHTMTQGSQTLVEPGHAVTTVAFTWMPGYIEWNVWYGTDTTLAPDLTLRMTEGEKYSYVQPYGGNTFAGTVSIPATGAQQVIMNLWTPSAAGVTSDTEVIIRSFSYTPSS